MSKLTRFLIIIIPITSLGYFLTLVFSSRLILPQSFSIGPIKIYYYGIILALAVASAFLLAKKRADRYGISEKQAEDIIFWTIIGGFIGARLYHVVSSAGYYLQHPVDVTKVWNGGLSIYGAIIGGIIAIILVSKVTFDTLDWLAASVLLGQIIGRFGNLFNYEAFGYPTNLPWKMFVPGQFRPEQYASSSFFHPWFLYEVLGNLIILFLLLKIIPSRVLDKAVDLDPGYPRMHSGSEMAHEGSSLLTKGQLFFCYVLLYNVLRFSLEFMRIDSTFVGVFRLNSLVSLVLILVSGLFLYKQWKNTTKYSQ